MGYCDLDCEKCNSRLATIYDDDNLRVVQAAMYSNIFGLELTKEDINCDGCKCDGKKLWYCANCEIRACAIEHKVEKCKECQEYPCDKIKNFGKIDESRATLA